MPSKPIQIAGFLAVVVFGCLFAWLEMQPKPDPMRGAQPLGLETPIVGDKPPSPSISATPNHTAGSAEARDDLYCSGVIYASYRAAADPMSDAERRKLLLAPALASAGADKLIKEGVATPASTALFADALSDAALSDFAKGAPRIPVADCHARGERALTALR